MLIRPAATPARIRLQYISGPDHVRISFVHKEPRPDNMNRSVHQEKQTGVSILTEFHPQQNPKHLYLM